jgi:hypothetical protein
VTSAADPAGPLVAGTLRYAVDQANQDAKVGQSDGITFDTAQMGTSTVTLQQGALTLDVGNTVGPVGTETIDGGGTVIVSGNQASADFQINNDVQAALTGLTIQNGNGNFGGGISNFGSLTLSNSTLTGNSADSGGGIYNQYALSLTNVTLRGNSASYGGGIDNAATLVLQSVTLSGNSASVSGGGINNLSSFEGPVPLTLQSTIVAGNTAPDGPDISGTVAAASAYNLIGDGGALLGISDHDANGNIVGHPALLAPLGNYGGPTQTMALLPGSLAIGNGGPAGPNTPATDQRGFPRPTSLLQPLDIGAFQTQASPFVVTTATDPGGISGKLSLREAVNLANLYAAAGSPATITFDTAQMGTATVTLQAGQLVLDVSGTMVPVGTETIDGGGVVHVSGNQANRVFEVDLGVQAAFTGLTIQDGNTADFGGGIFNFGTLTLTNATIRGNRALNGGGIKNVGTLTVTDSTLSGNSAGTPFLGGGGGGIFNVGTLTVSNNTLSGNFAGLGGGIYNKSVGTVTVRNSTLSGNSASFTGGGIYNLGTVTLQSTIVAGDTAPNGPDIFGALTTDSAYNLVGDGSGLSGISDNDANHNIVGHPALLGPLGNYGGPTQTMALLAGSPAIANGSPAGPGVPTTDQRGFPRPLSSQVDIGAFQTQATAVAVSPSTAIYSPNSQTITLTATVTDNGQTMPQATGAVTFTVLVPGGTNLTTGPVALNNKGVATTQLTLPAAFSAGNYTLSASYSDSSGVFSPSSGSSTLTVQPAAPTVNVAGVSLTYSPTRKQETTLTATVTLGGAAVAEGVVTFLVSAPSVNPGAPPVVLGQVQALVNAQGVAVARLPVAAAALGGTDTIAAAFVDSPGSGNYASAGGSGALTITPAATTITLQPLPTLISNATKAQTIVLAGVVQSPAGTVPNGTFTFSRDGKTLLRVAVDQHGNFSAVLTIPAGAPPGSYSGSASYTDQVNAIGGVNFASSTTTATLIIQPAKHAPNLRGAPVVADQGTWKLASDPQGEVPEVEVDSSLLLPPT